MTPLYRGKAALARTLEPQPVRPAFKLRPWALLAWLTVAVLAALTLWSRA